MNREEAAKVKGAILMRQGNTDGAAFGHAREHEMREVCIELGDLRVPHSFE